MSASAKQITTELETLAGMAKEADRRRPATNRIELNVRDMTQLFNSMDPSPFHEKDLDHDAEEFIVSWAQEFHRKEPIELVVHLEKFPTEHEPQKLIEQAVHHYFAYRAKLNQLEFRQLMKQGRTSLLIGLPFLFLCLVASEFLTVVGKSTLLNLAVQSLAIAGWVAMWKPLQIYLYDWWPLRRRGQIFQKLSQMPVDVRKKD